MSLSGQYSLCFTLHEVAPRKITYDYVIGN